jgi:hypothetical protein
MTVIAVVKVIAGLIALALVLLPLLAAVAAIRDGVRRLIRGRRDRLDRGSHEHGGSH